MSYYKYFIRDGIEGAYPELITLLNEYRDYIDMLARTADYDYLRDGLIQYFKVAALNALVELFISIKKLLELSHWRAASILIRTLFEFLINIEYIFLNPVETEELCAQFFKFSELQEVQHVRKDVQNNKYNIHNKIDPKSFRLNDMIRESKRCFKEFIKSEFDNGAVAWNPYWHLKSPKQIVDELNNPVRKKQYKNYYSNLSDFVHGSPIFVSSGVYLPEQIDNNEIDEIENNHVFNQANDLLLFSNAILRIIGNISPKFQKINLESFIQRLQRLIEENNIKGITNNDTTSKKEQSQDIDNIFPNTAIKTVFNLDFAKSAKEGNLIVMKTHSFEEKVSLRFKKDKNVIFHRVDKVTFKITPSGFIHCTIIGQDQPIGEMMQLPTKIIINEEITKFPFEEFKEYIVE